MKRGKTLLAVLATALILISVRSSIAYFTAKDQTDNVFTIGTVDITLEEPKWDKTADHTITPGTSYEKDPTIKNVGDTDAFVRIHVIVTDHAAFLEEDPDFDPTTLFTGFDAKWVKTKEAAPGTEADTVEMIYTYQDILPAGESTSPLFTGVTMPSFADDGFVATAGGSFDVTVYADAIQAEGFNDYTAAFAAFEQAMP